MVERVLGVVARGLLSKPFLLLCMSVAGIILFFKQFLLKNEQELHSRIIIPCTDLQ